MSNNLVERSSSLIRWSAPYLNKIVIFQLKREDTMRSVHPFSFYYHMTVRRRRNCRRWNRSIPPRPRGRLRMRELDTWKLPRCRVSRTDRKPEPQSIGRPLQWSEKKQEFGDCSRLPSVAGALWSRRLKFQWVWLSANWLPLQPVSGHASIEFSNVRCTWTSIRLIRLLLYNCKLANPCSRLLISYRNLWILHWRKLIYCIMFYKYFTLN